MHAGGRRFKSVYLHFGKFKKDRNFLTLWGFTNVAEVLSSSPHRFRPTAFFEWEWVSLGIVARGAEQMPRPGEKRMAKYLAGFFRDGVDLSEEVSIFPVPTG